MIEGDLSDAEDSPMIEGEGLSKVEDLSEEPFDFAYLSEPEDYSMFESSISRGAQTRLFWNLEHYPISESANLVSIHRNIKLALHRVGVHGFLEIFAYGAVKPNRDKRDLSEACIHYMPPHKGGQLSIAGQMSLDILLFAEGLYPDRTAFVVIAKHIPEIEETKRVLQCLQTRYQNAVLIVDPTAHDGPFQSADSVYHSTQFVDGGKTRPRIPSSQRLLPVQEISTGVFWDAKDCPFPVGWSADTIYTKIRSAFTEAYCVSGNMSISCYADEMNHESWGKFMSNKPPESRIDHFFLQGDKPARLERMLNDILLWVIHNPYPADLIVVADNLRDEIFEMLGSFVDKGYNVFLVTPSKDTGPERHDWPGSLVDQVHAFVLGAESQSESESETKSPSENKSESESETKSPRHKKHKAGDDKKRKAGDDKERKAGDDV